MISQHKGWVCRYLIWIPLVLVLLSFGQKASAQSLTNNDVVKMVQAQLGDSVIIAKIKSSRCEFDTSPDALISLKQAGVSNSVLQAMTESMTAPPVASEGRSTGALLPTALGYYVMDGSEIRSLSAVGVETRIGISVGGNGFGVDGLSGDPPIAVRTSKPTIIVYQQNLDVNSLHLSNLVYVSAMKAFQFNMIGTDPPFFRNIYGRDYNETIPVNLWRPKPDVPFHVEPVEGKPGMYRLIPDSPLQPGRYALFSGDEIHRDGMIFGTRAGRRSQAFYFSVSGTASASTQPPAVPAAACADYNSCITAGDRFLSNQDYAEALGQFKNGLQFSPANPDLLAREVVAMAGVDDFTDAEETAEKAIEAGGTIRFPVVHKHAFTYCEGDFVIQKGKVSYQPKSGNDGFALSSGGLIDISSSIWGNLPDLVVRWRTPNGKDEKKYVMVFPSYMSRGAGRQVLDILTAKGDAVDKTTRLDRMLIDLVQENTK
jgi:hypothetical protein